MTRRYRGWLTTLPDVVVDVYGDTRGKAKADVYRAALDAFGWRGVSFTQVRVRNAEVYSRRRAGQ
jgi:hypothetical protein